VTVRWLLVKDLQILRRSPLQLGVLCVYPVAIALMIGFALSSPPSKPVVAVYSGAPASGTLRFGSAKVNVSSIARQLFASVRAIQTRSPAAAIAQVRDGRALAALIIPDGLAGQIQSLVTSGTGTPSVQIVLNASNPIDRQFVQQTLQSRIDQAEQALSKLVLKVAVTDLHEVLAGGNVAILGQAVKLLGLERSRTLLAHVLTTLPPGSPAGAPLRQVVDFANLAIDGLTFASPILGSIGKPVSVVQTEIAGRTTPTASYAVAIAAVVSLMFVALLVGAGLLALERSEHAYGRLVRGLVKPEALLAEKVILAAGCAAAVTLVMSAVVSIFVPLDWGRIELWFAALGLAGLAFGALGVALGGLAREVASASLLAFLCSLPVAFVALIPSTSVSATVADGLKVVSFAFPFKAGLDAVSSAFNAGSAGIALPLLHLALLTVVFMAGARVALRRFADS
jgi:hypothetical protein